MELTLALIVNSDVSYRNWALVIQVIPHQSNEDDHSLLDMLPKVASSGRDSLTVLVKLLAVGVRVVLNQLGI